MSIAAQWQTPALRSFYQRVPQDLSQVAISCDVDRAQLARALQAYHQDLGTLDLVEPQLHKLAQPGSATVTTGQQAGILLGPAFSVHKAIDTILLARELSTPERAVIPIFWVASQDHDSEEVNHTTLLDFNEKLIDLRLNFPQHIPIGRIPLQQAWWDSIEQAVQQAQFPYAAQTLAWLKTNYQGTVADWFARLMQTLLGKEGLVVLDPMHPQIAALMSEVMERELQQPLVSSQAIEQAAQKLQTLGFEPALRRPAHSTNLFLEGEDGHRRILRFDRGSFTAEKNYTLAQLQEILRQHPSRITPAAGFRPIVQDSMLPNLVSVLGPGEIAYATQLLGVYQAHEVQQPVLWRRMSVTYLEPPVERILQKYQLSHQEFQHSPEAAFTRVALGHDAVKNHLNNKLQELKTLVEDLGAPLPEDMKSTTERSKQRMLGQINRLDDKYTHYLLNHQHIYQQQLQRLNIHLLPHGIPQERCISFVNYLLKYGDYPKNALLALPSGFMGKLVL